MGWGNYLAGLQHHVCGFCLTVPSSRLCEFIPDAGDANKVFSKFTARYFLQGCLWPLSNSSYFFTRFIFGKFRTPPTAKVSLLDPLSSRCSTTELDIDDM